VKLVRFGPAGSERPGVLVGGERLDCSGFGLDWGEAFFGAGGLARLAAWLEQHAQRLPRAAPDARWGAPIARPSKVVGIGMNYADHVRETGARMPAEPLLFQKASSAVCGPYDDLVLPAGASQVDWEVELAVVIGAEARCAPRERALAHVAGYCAACDVSERAWQKERGGQFTKGKSADGFAPLGPWLATSDELPDPGRLALSLDLNGAPRQRGSTSDMLFGVADLVSYVSAFMTLLPGDVITTGTPAGVGLGRKPPEYLRAGDLLELEVEGLGRQRRRVTEPGILSPDSPRPVGLAAP
jgi:2-keto-4-pentenoate hydratase/2-oxohepta-3-ene-1,7-dioic acid hydratase in catechol pathway